jgi:hypothetical protein
VYVLLVLINLKRLRSWTGSPSTQCRGRIRASSHVSKAARRHPSAPDRPLLGWGWAATCGDCSGMPLWHIPAGGLRRGVDRALPTPESPEAPGLPCQVVAAGRPISSPSTCNFRCGTNPTPLLESEHLATLQRTRRGQAPCYQPTTVSTHPETPILPPHPPASEQSLHCGRIINIVVYIFFWNPTINPIATSDRELNSPGITAPHHCNFLANTEGTAGSSSPSYSPTSELYAATSTQTRQDKIFD